MKSTGIHKGLLPFVAAGNAASFQKTKTMFNFTKHKARAVLPGQSRE